MMKETLRLVLSVPGASGRETPISGAIASLLEGKVDHIKNDALGNLIATKKGQPGGKRIMISAHMDQIGFIVTDADEKGFLSVHAVGGISPAVSRARPVIFENGVVGVLYAKPTKEALQMKDLFIDLGVSTRDEALAKAQIGDIAVYRFDMVDMGDLQAAPAMDDRAACAVLIELLYALENPKNEVVAVFSVQEEVGLRGATVAAYEEAPDIGIALDVTATGDTPDVEPKMAVRVGGGPAVKIMDRSLIASPVVRDGLIDAAGKAGVPFQREVLTFGGTDAGAIQTTRGGIPAGTLSIACRYVHTPTETVSLTDMEQCVALLKAYVDLA